ncbi:IclR family transcriptional regulator [Nocardioides sp. NPDC006303]|uniref:IclR family transcriptional regulator n=1 Tax=Nocardioides sp. NPDC006303 TaxID=3156747 RepID=UPI0033B21D86
MSSDGDGDESSAPNPLQRTSQARFCVADACAKPCNWTDRCHTGLHRGPIGYRRGRRVRSVRTTFKILEAVAENQPIGLSELSRRLELPKSTVQRSLATLSDLGWIRTDRKDSGRWTLGDRVRTLSDSVDDLGRLREAALGALQRLNNETLETIHLAVVEGSTMRLVERQDSKHPLRLVKPIGTRSPLHASSTGKAALALLPQTEIDAYIADGLSAETIHTLTDPQKLLEDLEQVRERGYALADEELTDGIRSIAAAITPEDRPVASISISGPVNRLGPDLIESYGRLVQEAAEEAAKNLRS